MQAKMYILCTLVLINMQLDAYKNKGSSIKNKQSSDVICQSRWDTAKNFS